MTAPLIAIVGRISETATAVRGPAFAAGRQYFHAVERARGIPVMVPPEPALIDRVDDLVRRIDGVVMHGGGDVDPRRYGQTATADELYGIVPEHDEVELAVLTAALAADLPVLAICRGMQVLNVALGGSLHQHIGNDDHWFAYTAHQLTPHSRVAEAMGTTTPSACHCVHHQALDRVADALTVTSVDAAGLVHSVELADRAWVVGTQWHPEDSAATDPQQQGLFDTLVRRC